MAFDKQTLMPLYRLEIGEAGESCALYIAERLGLPEHLLERARVITYNSACADENRTVPPKRPPETILTVMPLEIEDEPEEVETVKRCDSFGVGYSVIVYPKKELGLVFSRSNAKGEIGVQIKGVKHMINHKRVKLKTPASELYPDDYDFSIIFDSVENRKARHQMSRKYVKGTTVSAQDWEDATPKSEG